MTTKIPVELSSTPSIVDNGDATAITIDSSENVGIGVTTPFSQTQITETGWSSGAPYGTVLTVTGNNTNDANWGHLLITDSSTGTGNGGMLRFATGSTSSDISPFAGLDGFTEGANYGGLKFLTRANGGTATERMRINSNGNVLIGSTTSIASNIGLQVTGTDGAGFISLFRDDSSVVANDDLGGILFYGDDNSATTQFASIRATAEGTHADGDNPTAIRFLTTSDGAEVSAERMRIDSSGILLKGKTTAGATSTEGFEISNNGLNMYSTQTSGAVTSTHHVLYGSTFKFYVGYNGYIYAANTTVQSLSDQRLKENVRDLDKGLSDILKLKPRRFDWKEGEGTDEKNVSGFIAQEVEDAGFEEFVGDFKHEDLDDAKSFGQGGLIPALVKAIQEQQAIIEDLQTQINELKNGN